MRTLFVMDAKNYDVNGKKLVRPSARGIIIDKEKIALVYSKKFHYYKFPGGGIKNGEDHLQALIREVKEELGLTVITSSVKEYGLVTRLEKCNSGGIFVQNNYYYFCECEKNILEQNLDDYEADEEFTLAFVNPIAAIKVNEQENHLEADANIILRDTKMLKLLISENYFALM